MICNFNDTIVQLENVDHTRTQFAAKPRCVLLHPWFVALAWWKLHGFPWDARLWFAFWLHDAGYIGKPNLDGPEGETHVELGARIMGLLFGKSWGAFTASHSRYWAKRNGCQVSRLCLADKLAFVLTPAWLYLPMAQATGELYEYMLRARERRAGSVHFTEEESRQLMSADARAWLAGLKSYQGARVNTAATVAILLRLAF